MPDARMVTVASTPDHFEARVIAARLGAEGIVWELRGGVGGPYPVGRVDVLVSTDDYESAAELLLADDVESAFDDEHEDDAARPPRELWVVVTVVVISATFVVGRILTQL